jgi:hypothetical protein
MIASAPANSNFASAVRVAVDPVTGEAVAPEYSGSVLTVAEVQELARREAAGLVTIQNADGSQTLNHEGRFTDFSVIRVGSDGERVFHCVHGQTGVRHLLQRGQAPMPKTEDR